MAVGRFSTLIERLPEAAHPVVVPWMEPLARLFGPLPAGAPSEAGDPDGYDGLDRRGPLERLLMSEWALLQENPDEFIRRFAMREVAYLHPRRSAPRSERWSVALFDAGPTMLGVPRLVHVALVLVLAERAERGGATFGVGTLQDRAELVPFDLDADRVRMVAGRSSRKATHDDVQRWRASVRPGSEIVVVGPGGASVVQARDHLVVSWEHGRVRLPMPLPAVALVAMQHLEKPPLKPRIAQRSPPTRLPLPMGLLHRSKPGTLFFSADGRRLIVREQTDGVDAFVAYHVPDSSKSSPGRPIRLQGPIGGVAAAVGWRGKQFVAVWVRAGHVIEGEMITAPDIPFRGIPDGVSVPQLVYSGSRGWIVMLEGNVWLWNGGNKHQLDTNIVAINRDFSRIQNRDGILWLRSERHSEERLGPYAAFALRDSVVFWSLERQRWLGGRPLVEIAEDPALQLLGQGPGEASAWFAEGPVVVLKDARAEKPRISWDAGGHVVESAVSELGERIAVRTEDNGILVFSERFGELVLRLHEAVNR
jgi:hypothetical protein